jgi:hypothetical protein
MLINESGNPGAAEAYGSVLAQIGYKVLSIAQRANTGSGDRKTVITYSPGKEAQARALARRIPGDKVLAASRDLPAEAVVIIR